MGSLLGKRCDNWEGARRRRSRRAHRYDVAIEKLPNFSNFVRLLRHNGGKTSKHVLEHGFSNILFPGSNFLRSL